MSVDDIDLTRPLLSFESLLEIFEYKETSMKDWCRAHPDVCSPINHGKFVANTARLVDWFGSGGAIQPAPKATRKRAGQAKTARRRIARGNS